MQAATKAPRESEFISRTTLNDPEDKEISLLGVAVVLVRRRRQIAMITVGVTLMGLILALLTPNRYSAYTAILPPQQGSSTGAALMAQIAGPAGAALMAGTGLGRNPNDLQVALLKSWTVEDAVIERFHLRALYRVDRLSKARTKLERNVEIESGIKDGLIRIYVTDKDPRRAAELANGYVEEFKKATAGLAVTEASQRRVFFERQIEEAKDNLATAEEDLKRTGQQTGLIQPDSQARAVIESVAQLRAQIAAKEVQIQGMQSFEAGENPDLAVAEQELAAMRAQQAKLGSSADSSSGGLLVSKGNMQQLDLEYVRKLREVKYRETIFDLLARQLEAARVDEARQGTMVQVVDPAIVPDTRSSPKIAIMVAGAFLLGLFLGIVWVILAEAMGRASNIPEERRRLDALREMLLPGPPLEGRAGQ